VLRCVGRCGAGGGGGVYVCVRHHLQ